LVVVVIGVMVAAILLGIALPVFAKYRESADRAVCLMQVQEIAVASVVDTAGVRSRCPIWT